MKIIIAGSRNFVDYDLLVEKCDKAFSLQSDIEIVSGTAYGADMLGERYAKEKNYNIKRFPADWSLGKGAGYIRNKAMSEYADALIAFWDGKSRGTKHMIDLATEKGLKVKVVMFDENKIV